MAKIKKIEVCNGVSWVEIPEADLRIQCGAPEDSVKHLMKRGLIVWTEENGVKYETGPNAILLSDTLIQNGHINNLAEFPVLQMLYRQGMMLPSHPNNKGVKPILIGTKEQVDAQFEYILRGNYGLLTEEEMIDAGLTPAKAKELMRQKLKFAFGKFQKSDAFLGKCYASKKPKEILNGVYIKNIDTNIYEISYEDEKIEVDVSIDQEKGFESPYYLSYFNKEREYFSVIHSGQGDGWNLEEPAMSSVVMFQGKIYLVDAGPNTEKVLMSLGIGINEIEGIFHTHGHDDHFSGILTLLRSDKKLKYFSTKLVRHSVSKKISALLSIEEGDFENYFEVVDLKEGSWNNIDGLEVKPIFVPHPIETNMFEFRTTWKEGYKTYGHYADLTSLTILKNMVVEDDESFGVTKDYYKNIKKEYLKEMDLKKIDVGGGMIHGEAEDFIDDKSGKIILAHTSTTTLNLKQKKIGSSAPFGASDILINNSFNYMSRMAYDLLLNMFPEIPRHYLMSFLNIGFTVNNPGSIILKESEKATSIKLVISGTAESICSSTHTIKQLTNGTIIGGVCALIGEEDNETIRAVSYVTTLDIPKKMFISVIEKTNYIDRIKLQREYIDFFQSSTLFKEEISHHTYNTIINTSKKCSFKDGEEIDQNNKRFVHIIKSGTVEKRIDGIAFKLLTKGEYFLYESSILDLKPLFQLTAKGEVETIALDAEIIKNIPILRWNIHESYEENRKFRLTIEDF